MNSMDEYKHPGRYSPSCAGVMLNIPPEPEGHPRMKHRCPSPLLGATNNLNLAPMPRKRASSFKKPKEKNLDMFLNDDMRPRTSSMPTRNSLRKPHAQDLRRAFLGLNIDPLGDRYTVRAFEMNSKGIIIKRSDSLRSRSTNSVLSSEGDIYPLSPLSQTSSSVSRESVRTSPGSVFPTVSIPTRVLITGAPDVGKTAIAQQFMTSEYLGGFDTSIDGETEKTVNVLLNGEETALSFIEQSELEDADDVTDSTAAYVIVYACDDKTSFDRAVDTLYNLRQKQHRDDVIFFVGNKSDLVRSRCVTADEAKAVAMTYNCKFVETSVVLNVHVDELLVGIVKQLRIRSEGDSDKSTGCASTSLSLLNKIFKKDSISKSCENLYA
ncbi:hypothetical protein ACF0H5_006207 [Mactra antiquata]